MEQYRLCPSCGASYKERPAISRKDSRIEICPECGLKEALESAGFESIFGETLRMYREARNGQKSRSVVS